jgi:hexosaminidase
MPFDEKYPAAKCEAYEPNRRYMTRTTRAAKKGDWLLYSFEKPVKCSYFKIATGYIHLYRKLIYNGYVEVCYDGTNFVKAGKLSKGAYIILPKGKPIHAVRIVAEGISDAEECVMIQSPVIK